MLIIVSKIASVLISLGIKPKILTYLYVDIEFYKELWFFLIKKKIYIYIYIYKINVRLHRYIISYNTYVYIRLGLQWMGTLSNILGL